MCWRSRHKASQPGKKGLVPHTPSTCIGKCHPFLRHSLLWLQAYHTYLAQMYLQSVLDQDQDHQQPAPGADQDAAKQTAFTGSNGSAALPPQAVDTQTNAYAKLKQLVRLRLCRSFTILLGRLTHNIAMC